MKPNKLQLRSHRHEIPFSYSTCTCSWDRDDLYLNHPTKEYPVKGLQAYENRRHYSEMVGDFFAEISFSPFFACFSLCPIWSGKWTKWKEKLELYNYLEIGQYF